MFVCKTNKKYCNLILAFLRCSWTDLRNPRHSVPCATCYGPTHWKNLAARKPPNTSLIIVCGVVLTSTG